MRSLLRSIYLDSEPGELIELEPAGTGLENPYVYDSAARELKAMAEQGLVTIVREETRHEVRKRVKRLRYLAELVAPLYKEGRVKRYLRTLGPAQDALGHFMDLVVATLLAREVVDGGDPRSWFNVGWLKAQLPGAVARCGKCLRGVVGADPFWR